MTKDELGKLKDIGKEIEYIKFLISDCGRKTENGKRD